MVLCSLTQHSRAIRITEIWGQEYAHVLPRDRRILEVPESIPLRLETLDHGMQSGAPDGHALQNTATRRTAPLWAS